MPANGAPHGFQRTGQNSSGGRLAIVLLALSIIMFTVSCRMGDVGVLGAARSVWQTVTMPISYIGSVAVQPFQGLGNIFANLTADQETLSQLQEENKQLVAENAELEEAQQTATRLQALLDLKDTYNLQSTAARIIDASYDNWSRTVTIDKGSSSGLAVGMPVTDAYGVIGQISEVSAATATVRLITDENSGVSAMVQSSRAQGMLNGSADGTLSLNLVRTDLTVNVGDIIVTSGLGGVYPKGLPLGTVTSVEKYDGAMYYTITVEPFTKTESYEEILVITSLTEDQAATSDDIAAADSQETSTSASTTTSTDASSNSSSDTSSDSSSASSSDSANSASGTSSTTSSSGTTSSNTSSSSSTSSTQ
ncbi:MAG: rod shape-determining protein MreC [Atopobiaceae bacterium]